MSMTAETLRLLASKGLSLDEIIQVAETLLPAPELATSKPSRTPGAKRVAAYRKRRRLSDAEWIKLKYQVAQRDGEQCQYCGSTKGPFHCDHRTPLIAGGTNDLDNLTMACAKCNASKSGRSDVEWSPPEGGWQ